MTRPTPQRLREDMSLGPLEVNQHVVARCRDGKHRWSHKWFPGVVRRINEDGTVAIDYEDGDQEERVPRKHACRREEEQALPTTLKLTGSGRRSTETDRLSSSKLGGELQYGKRMVKPLKSTPKRRAQERKEACVSPSCIQNLLGVLLLVRPTPAEEEEEEQEEGEVKLIGSRIRVYWTVAKAWYAGRVISAGSGASGSLHTVAYDDGAQATHYLQSAESSLNEKWETEPSPECKTPAKAEAAAAPKLPSSGPPKPTEERGLEWGRCGTFGCTLRDRHMGLHAFTVDDVRSRRSLSLSLSLSLTLALALALTLTLTLTLASWSWM